MKILMISLDKKLIDPTSAVARRMIAYGKKDELFILVPYHQKKEIVLSNTVRVYATGGSKVVQFFRLLTIGSAVIKQNTAQEITVQDPFYCGLVGWILKKKQPVSLEVQLHGDFFDGTYTKQWLARWIVKRADRVRVVGERVKQSVLKLGVDASKIVVRSVPIDEEKIKQSHSTVDLHALYPGYEKIFLAIGRLDPKKIFRGLFLFLKKWHNRRNICC